MNAVNILITNAGNILRFLKEFTVDSAKDVSITYINADGTESVNTFKNISKTSAELQSWKDSFISSSDGRYSGKGYKTIFIGTKGLDFSKDVDGNYINSADGALFDKERDIFYPVRFMDVAWTQGKTLWKVSRSSVHTDNKLYGNWYGSMILDFDGHNSNSGNGSNFIKFNQFRQYSQPTRGFVAKYATNTGLGIVLFLRGQCSYQVSGNGFPYEPIIYMDGIVDTAYQPLALADVTDDTQNIVVN